MVCKLLARFIFVLFVSLWSFCVAPRNASAQECSFDWAVYIQTAHFVANFDAAGGGMTSQALETAQRYLDSVRVSVPESCRAEMVASVSNAQLAQLCAPAVNAALPTVVQSSVIVSKNYAATGDRNAFISGVQTMMHQYVRSIPRQCWFAPPSQTATPPQQAPSVGPGLPQRDPRAWQISPGTTFIPGVGACGPSGCVIPRR